MNTSDSVKRVQPVSELPNDEAAELPRAGTKEPNRYTVTTRLYEEDLIDLDEPEVSITQQLDSEGYFAVVQEGERYRSVPVASFYVFSDGSLYGADEEGVDLAGFEGFAGFVFSDGTGMLRSERVEKLLEQTRREEV